MKVVAEGKTVNEQEELIRIKKQEFHFDVPLPHIRSEHKTISRKIC